VTFAASAVDPATGVVTNCFANPTKDGSASYCTIVGLTNGTAYQVTAISGSPQGNSPPTAAIAATPVPVPTAGIIRKYSEPSRGKVRFLVSPSQDNGAPLTANDLICQRSPSKPQMSVAIDARIVTMSGLRRGRYLCYVQATNQYGSTMSPVVAVKVTR
jgi:hypothetical protein